MSSALYYKIYDVVFTLSYRSKEVSVKSIHRYLLSSVRRHKYDIVNFILQATGFIGSIYSFKRPRFKSISMHNSACSHLVPSSEIIQILDARYQDVSYKSAYSKRVIGVECITRCCALVVSRVFSSTRCPGFKICWVSESKR